MNFVSAHYAFYFRNEFPIQKDDYIAVYLPPEFYPTVNDTDVMCAISYLPQGLYLKIFIFIH